MQLSGHAETLAPIFAGFGERLITRPAPGSAIFIEFFEYDTKLYVKTFYKETAKAEPKIFKIDSYVKVNDFYDGGVGIDDFQRFVNFKLYSYDSNEPWGGGIMNDLPTACAKILTPVPKYFGQEQYRSALFNLWGIPCTDCDKPFSFL
jgi:hypothetical protein